MTSRKAGGVCGIHVGIVKVGGCTVVQWLKERLMWLGNVEGHLKNRERLLLPLAAHAPQGYSSCVCVSSSIFSNSNKSARKTYGLPQRCNRLI